MRKTLAEKFWPWVAKAGPDDCWHWKAAITTTGYGQVRNGPRQIKAHRAAWELVNGPIPEGLLVCHRCDNPVCVNPAHLFLGTPADNNRDKANKGRCNAPRGEDNHYAKLTTAQVIEIRQASGSQYEIARKYGVRQQQISRIRTGLRWRHVAV